MTRTSRGSALLAVLWLSLALSAIAFSLASTVQGETERVSTSADGVRSYYLAAGAIERAILYMQWGKNAPANDESPYYLPWRPVMRMSFPTGEAEVEVIPETAKYDLNKATPDDLARLLTALGARDAVGIADAIVDWRTQSGVTAYDQYYLSLTPSFRARHASFEEVEELLVVKGITPDLYYGTYAADATGRLIPVGGLGECVSIYGTLDRFDINTAHPAVLASLGLTPGQVQAVVQRRRLQPFRPEDDLGAFGTGKLRIGGNTMFTLRATARLKLANGQLSDLRRTVAAQVKFMPPGFEGGPYHIMRWYDSASRN